MAKTLPFQVAQIKWEQTLKETTNSQWAQMTAIIAALILT